MACVGRDLTTSAYEDATREFVRRRRHNAPQSVWHSGGVAIVTVFRSRLRPGIDDDYVVVANEMSRLAHSMEGFLDEKLYLAPDGERVTIVRFADMASQRAWATHPDHLVAQQRGRDAFYSWYSITVAHEDYSREFDAEHP